MSKLIVVFCVLVGACQSVTTAVSAPHSDIEKAIDVWGRAKVDTYTYVVEYKSKGCLIAVAEVTVVRGEVSSSLLGDGPDPCSPYALRESDRLIERSVSALFIEIINFDHGPTAEFRLPVKARFDDALGYPLYFGIDAAADDKIYGLPADGSVASDYEYRIMAFKALENGT